MKTFKKAIQLFIAQWKWNGLIGIFMCISITAILSLYFSSDGIKNYLEERAYEAYGEFDGVFYDVPDGNEDYATYGLAGVIDSPNLEDKLSLGWMSEKMFDWGNIELTEGSLPQKENEVVVEEFYINQIDSNWEVSETRSFRVKGEEYHLSLSGIIENYSYRWSRPNDYGEKGVTDYPNLITSENNQFTDANELYAVQLNGTISHKKNEMFQEFNEEGFPNNNLYNEGLMDYEALSIISIVFQIIVLLLMLISVSLALSYYRANYHNKLGTYKAIGFSNKMVIKLETIQLIILFLGSVLLSVPFVFLLTKLFVHFTFGNSVFQFNWKHLLTIIIWLILILTVYLYKMRKEIKKLLKHSILHLVNGMETDEQAAYPQRYVDYAKGYITNNLKSFVRYTLIFVFCMMSVFLALYLEKETAGIWEVSDDYFIDHKGYAFKYMDNQFVLASEYIPFPYERVEGLRDNPNIDNVFGEPDMLDVVPLVSEEEISDTLKQYIESFYPRESETVYEDLQREYSNDNDLPWNDIRYTWSDKDTYAQLFDIDNTEDTSEPVDNRLFILFPQQTGLEEEDFNKMDQVVLSKIIQDDDNQIQQDEWLYHIDGAAQNPDENAENVTFHLIEEQAIENDISSGFSSFYINLENDLSGADQEGTHQQIIHSIASVPNVLFQDLNVFRVEDTRIARYVGFVGTINFWVIMILVSIALYLMIFGRFLANKQRWGTYLATGLNKGKMVGLLSMELAISYTAAIIISIILFTIMMWNNTLYPLSYYFSDLIFSFAITFLFLSTIILCLYFKIKSLSIQSLFR